MNHSSIDSFQKFETAEAVLLHFGVFALSSARRGAVADLCRKVGIPASGLAAIFEFVREGSPDDGTARRYIATIAADEAKLADAWVGVSAHLKARQAEAKPKDESPEHIFNMPIGTPSCPCHTCRDHRQALSQEPWDHDRKCDMAACLVGGDRWTIERVAQFFDVTETTARAMVDRGNHLKGARQDKPKKKAKDDTVSEDRCKQFREAPRSERLRLLRGDA